MTFCPTCGHDITRERCDCRVCDRCLEVTADPIVFRDKGWEDITLCETHAIDHAMDWKCIERLPAWVLRRHPELEPDVMAPFYDMCEVAKMAGVRS